VIRSPSKQGKEAAPPRIPLNPSGNNPQEQQKIPHEQQPTDPRAGQSRNVEKKAGDRKLAVEKKSIDRK